MSLTRREREVLTLVASGYVSKDIARMLRIKPRTVDIHRTHICKKLNLHNSVLLTLWAVYHGMVNPAAVLTHTLQRSLFPEPPFETCCENESRNINGGCDNCGDPAL
jgi:DNA-binding CsgD family transcriptional regulator